MTPWFFSESIDSLKILGNPWIHWFLNFHYDNNTFFKKKNFWPPKHEKTCFFMAAPILKSKGLLMQDWVFILGSKRNIVFKLLLAESIWSCFSKIRTLYLQTWRPGIGGPRHCVFKPIAWYAKSSLSPVSIAKYENRNIWNVYVHKICYSFSLFSGYNINFWYLLAKWIDEQSRIERPNSIKIGLGT